MKHLLALLLFLLTFPLTAQLEIVPGRVGVGRTPVEDASFEAVNLDDKRYAGFFLSNLNDAATSFALYAKNFKPRGNSFGAYFYSYDNSTSLSYDVTGLKINNDVWGTGDNTGIYLTLNGYGGGEKIGSYVYVADNYGASNNGSTAPLSGHRVRLINQNRPQATAFYAEALGFNSGNTTRAVYGYRFVKTGSGLGTTYGVHSSVPVSHGYAGYFDGNVLVTGSVTEMSDESLKTDILDITDATDILRAVRPRSYHFLEETGLNVPASEVTSFGFLAQELEEVLPDLVVEVRSPAKLGYPEGVEPDPSDTLGLEEGRLEEIMPATVKKGIRYGEFIPLLVRAFQEQADLIDALPGDLDLLRANGSVFADKIRALAAENQALREEVTTLRTELNNLAEAVADLRNCTDCYGNRPLEDIDPATGKSSVYPNPARSQLTVNAAVTGDYRLVVRDAGGKERYSSVYSTSLVTLDITDWPAGLYLVEIVQEGSVRETLKATVVR